MFCAYATSKGRALIGRELYLGVTPPCGTALGGGEQAEGAGPLDGLAAAVRVQLVVDVAHVRPDGVHRHRQLPGDLLHGQAGRQVPQHADLAAFVLAGVQLGEYLFGASGGALASAARGCAV